jgi:predicted nucleic acid-binding protein
MTFKIPVGGRIPVGVGEIRVSASTSVGVFLDVMGFRSSLTSGEARAVAVALEACAREVDLHDGPARGATR